MVDELLHIVDCLVDVQLTLVEKAPPLIAGSQVVINCYVVYHVLHFPVVYVIIFNMFFAFLVL